jgi:hypothetical protein
MIMLESALIMDAQAFRESLTGAIPYWEQRRFGSHRPHLFWIYGSSNFWGEKTPLLRFACPGFIGYSRFPGFRHCRIGLAVPDYW